MTDQAIEQEIQAKGLTAAHINSAELEACESCGQVDIGQTGEYPCKACGLPVEHDQKA